MNVRKNWISASSNDYNSVVDTIIEVKDNYDVRRYYSAEGKSVVIDNITTQVLIQSHLNPLNDGKYDKKIHMPIESIVNTGSIVEWESNYWIIVSNIDDIGAYKSASMIKCNNTLNFYDENSILYEIPCIVGKGNVGLDENKFLSIPADENIVTCPNTTNSLKIDENTRFILSDDAYSILGIDKISNVGLLNIRIKEDQVTEDDNLTLGIANYYSHQHVYVVSILNNDATLYVDDTLTLSVVCTDNSNQVLSPTLTYQSSDINVATVVNGIVSCIAEGNATITVTYNGISDSINLIIQSEEITPNYIVSITGATTVKLNTNITLTATIFNNGIIDGTKSVIWEVFNQDGTDDTYVSIVSQTSNSIVLKATNSAYISKYVVVQARKLYDALVFDEHVIQIRSIF
ncbi:MAG: hypothetical protein M0R51_09065 [Clostridia bacterium]|jgi:hypothetical protein|nr:hypothetical protein [Clostridia bacterium]